MSAEARLAALGIVLPPPHRFPNANRTGCVRSGPHLFVSGHPPAEGQGAPVHGKVPAEVPEADAYRSARAAALNILSSVRAQLGTLDAVARVVKVFGMVNSSPGFERQFAVIDGASDLFVEVFGPELGQHARSAVGMFELPRRYPVEVEAVFELR
jgi:enamine deaminase RidA (YjgF/YER057c/UK114 family)